MKVLNVSLMHSLLEFASKFLVLNIKSVFAGCLAAVALAACGGGGGAGGPVTSTLSFHLQSGMRAAVKQGSSADFTVSGTCSGTANLTSSVPIPTTFEGSAAVSSSGSATLNLPNCSPSYISGTGTDYYDSNYDPLGSIDSSGNYGVYTTPPAIPVSVKVGDSGTIGTEKFYSDNTKTFLISQNANSYVIEPDTAYTAIVNMISKSYDASGTLTSTEQDRSRIMPDGTLIPFSADLQYANGSTTHLIFTAVPDTVPPTVISTSPPSFATNVTVATAIAATFSEPMDTATVATAEFTLMDGTTPVPGEVTYSGKTVTFTPTAFLTPSTIYIAKITTGAKDWAGNAMSANYSWQFQTSAADLTPPTVLSTIPIDTDPSVAINSTITATFSETMDPATVTTDEFNLMDGTTPVSGTVTYSGTTATFTPDAPLANDTLYTVTITTGVKDLVGNTMMLPYTWDFTSAKKITGLNFTVVDAEYSKSLNKIIMVSSAPSNQLHIYDPVTGTDTAVTLNLAPTSISVSPDGLYAAVGHNAYISYVDLSSATLVKILPVSADVFDIVLAGNGYVYAFPRVDQWIYIHAINISTGVETLSTGTQVRAGTTAKLNGDGTAIYGATNGLSPSSVEKYDITPGTPAYGYANPSWGTYAVCGDLWMSEDGSRIFTKCGNVFNATSAKATDMVYGGALQNLGLVRHLSQSSAIGKVTAIPDNGYGITDADTEIRIFDSIYLTFEQSIKLPYFIVGNNAYTGHGRFVFYNSSGTKSFVVLQADSSSGLSYGFGIITY